ncbi:hypothetical protein E4U19_000803 [Claviceps sp. Clav32 group G5]|nr:hypothetical protein E4U19_000803 [Claviceps sp. Clav32 group G5]
MKVAAWLLSSAIGAALAAPDCPPPPPQEDIFDSLQKFAGAPGFCAILLQVPVPTIKSIRTITPQPFTVSGETKTVIRNVPGTRRFETRTFTACITNTLQITDTFSQDADRGVVATDVQTVTVTRIHTAQATNALQQTVIRYLTGHITSTVIDTATDMQSQAAADASAIVATITKYAAGFVTATFYELVAPSHTNSSVNRGPTTLAKVTTLSLTDSLIETATNTRHGNSTQKVGASDTETTQSTDYLTTTSTVASSYDVTISNSASDTITATTTDSSTPVTSASASALAAAKNREKESAKAPVSAAATTVSIPVVEATKNKQEEMKKRGEEGLADADPTKQPVVSNAASLLSSACSRLKFTPEAEVVYYDVTAARPTVIEDVTSTVKADEGIYYITEYRTDVLTKTVHVGPPINNDPLVITITEDHTTTIGDQVTQYLTTLVTDFVTVSQVEASTQTGDAANPPAVTDNVDATGAHNPLMSGGTAKAADVGSAAQTLFTTVTVKHPATVYITVTKAVDATVTQAIPKTIASIGGSVIQSIVSVPRSNGDDSGILPGETTNNGHTPAIVATKGSNIESSHVLPISALTSDTDATFTTQPLLTLSSVTAAAISTSTSAVNGLNLIKNGDFETGVVAPWISAGNYSLVKGHESVYGLSLRTPTPTSDASRISQTIDTVPGTLYRLSFYMNPISGGSNSILTCTASAVNAVGVGIKVPTNVDTNRWSLRSFTFTAPGTSIIVEFELDSAVALEARLDDTGSTVASEAILDDISVVVVSYSSQQPPSSAALSTFPDISISAVKTQPVSSSLASIPDPIISSQPGSTSLASILDPATSIQPVSTSLVSISDPAVSMQPVSSSLASTSDPAVSMQPVSSSLASISDPAVSIQPVPTSLASIPDPVVSSQPVSTSLVSISDPTVSMQPVSSSLASIPDPVVSSQPVSTSLASIPDSAVSTQSISPGIPDPATSIQSRSISSLNSVPATVIQPSATTTSLSLPVTSTDVISTPIGTDPVADTTQSIADTTPSTAMATQPNVVTTQPDDVTTQPELTFASATVPIISASTGAAAVNMVKNGDFEAGTVVPWTPAGEYSLVEGHNSVYGLSLRTMPPTLYTSSISQTIETVPGTLYRLSFYMKPITGGSNSILTSTVSDAVGTNIKIPTNVDINKWSLKSFMFTAPGTSIVVSFKIDSTVALEARDNTGSTVASEAVLDDISVIMVPFSSQPVISLPLSTVPDVAASTSSTQPIPTPSISVAESAISILSSTTPTPSSISVVSDLPASSIPTPSASNVESAVSVSSSTTPTPSSISLVSDLPASSIPIPSTSVAKSAVSISSSTTPTPSSISVVSDLPASSIPTPSASNVESGVSISSSTTPTSSSLPAVSASSIPIPSTSVAESAVSISSSSTPTPSSISVASDLPASSIPTPSASNAESAISISSSTTPTPSSISVVSDLPASSIPIPSTSVAESAVSISSSSTPTPSSISVASDLPASSIPTPSASNVESGVSISSSTTPTASSLVASSIPSISTATSVPVLASNVQSSSIILSSPASRIESSVTPTSSTLPDVSTTAISPPTTTTDPAIITTLPNLSLPSAIVPAVTSSTGATDGANLLRNGDFETGAISPWIPAGTYSLVSGRNSAHGISLRTSPPTSFTGVISQTITTKPGTLYRFSFFMNPLSGGSNSILTCTALDAVGTSIKIPTNVDTNQWSQKSFTFTAPGASIIVDCKIDSTVAAEALLDDISVTLASSSTLPASSLSPSTISDISISAASTQPIATTSTLVSESTASIQSSLVASSSIPTTMITDPAVITTLPNLSLPSATIPAVSASTGAADGANLLKNGDFETGAISPWIPAGTYSLVAGRNSAHGISLRTSPPTSLTGIISQTITTKPGTLYRFSFFMNPLSGGSNSILTCTALDAIGTSIKIPTNVDTNQWSQRSFTFTAPGASIIVGCKIDSTVAAEALLDDISVTLASSSSSLSSSSLSSSTIPDRSVSVSAASTQPIPTISTLGSESTVGIQSSLVTSSSIPTTMITDPAVITTLPNLSLPSATIPAVSASTGAADGTNLVKNGDFETGALSPWIPAGTYSLVAGRNSAHGISLRTSPPTSLTGIISQTITTKPGTLYRFSFYMNPLSGGSNSILTCTALDAVGTSIKIPTNVDTNQWSQKSFTFTAPGASIIVGCKIDSTVAAEALLDDISVTLASSSSSLPSSSFSPTTSPDVSTSTVSYQAISSTPISSIQSSQTLASSVQPSLPVTTGAVSASLSQLTSTATSVPIPASSIQSSSMPSSGFVSSLQSSSTNTFSSILTTSTDPAVITTLPNLSLPSATVPAVTASTGAADGANLLKNGDFETGALSPWIPAGTYSLVAGRNSAHGISLRTSPPTSATGIISQTITTKPGTLYRFSFFMNPLSGGSNSILTCTALDAVGTSIKIPTNVDTNQWSQRSFTFTAPGASIIVGCKIDSTVAAEALLDDISVTLASSSTLPVSSLSPSTISDVSISAASTQPTATTSTLVSESTASIQSSLVASSSIPTIMITDPAVITTVPNLSLPSATVPAVSASTGAADGTNLLKNGDFETGALSPWIPAGTYSLVAGRNSAHGISLHTSPPTSVTGIISQTITTKPGTLYRFSFFMNPLSGGSNSILTCTALDAVGTSIKIPTNVDTNQWSQKSFTFTAPGASIIVGCKIDSTVAAEALLDDISVTLASSSSSLSSSSLSSSIVPDRSVSVSAASTQPIPTTPTLGSESTVGIQSSLVASSSIPTTMITDPAVVTTLSNLSLPSATVPAVSASTGAADGTNLVKNGDFETGALSPWIPAGTYSLVAGRNSAHGISLRTSPPTSLTGIISQTITTKPGTLYRFSFYMNPISGGSNSILTCTALDAVGTSIKIPTNVDTNQWSQKSFTFTAPGASIIVGCKIDSTVTAAEALLDDISVTLASSSNLPMSSEVSVPTGSTQFDPPTPTSSIHSNLTPTSNIPSSSTISSGILSTSSTQPLSPVTSGPVQASSIQSSLVPSNLVSSIQSSVALTSSIFPAVSSPPASSAQSISSVTSASVLASNIQSILPLSSSPVFSIESSAILTTPTLATVSPAFISTLTTNTDPAAITTQPNLSLPSSTVPVVTASTGAADGANLVKNGDFETGAISPWIPAGTYSLIAGRNSAHGISLRTSPPTSLTGIISQTITTKPGTLYRFSFYMNPISGDSNSILTCTALDAVGTSIKIPTNVETNQWSKKSFTFTAPGASIIVGCKIDSTVTAAEALLDDISVMVADSSSQSPSTPLSSLAISTQPISGTLTSIPASAISTHSSSTAVPAITTQSIMTPSSVTVSAASTSTAGACSLNLVQNGDFETGALSPWIPAGTYGLVAGRDSAHGISLRTSPPTSLTGIISQTITTKPGTLYRFSFYMKPISGDSNSILTCTALDAVGTSIKVPTNVGTNQWSQKSFTFTAPGASIVVGCKIDSTVAAEALLDDISVTQAC